jgi:hypothetical protein
LDWTAGDKLDRQPQDRHFFHFSLYQLKEEIYASLTHLTNRLANSSQRRW